MSQLDILAAVLELCKVEFVNLLELCSKIIFNITCELARGQIHAESFGKKVSQLQIPRILVGRLIHNAKISGAMTNKPIRTLMGMAIANMSFHKQLVVELTQEQGAIAVRKCSFLTIYCCNISIVFISFYLRMRYIVFMH